MKNFWGYDMGVRSRLLRGFANCCRMEHLRYYLSCGTALAAYRDHVFIPHSTDVDIDCMAEELTPELLENLRIRLKSAGLTLNGGYNAECISVTLEGEVLSLRRLRLEGDWRVYRRAKHPARFWGQHNESIEFDGMTHLIPTPIEEYLEDLYENWKVPSFKTGNSKSFIARIREMKK